MTHHLLKDKVVLVTGASRGIGQGIALMLGREGATVIGTSTSEKGAESISQRLSESAIAGRGAVLDVTDAASVDALLQDVKKEYGAVNVLINNAAVTEDNLLMRMKEEEWIKVIETNLNSIYRISKACIRDMLKAKWGRIINIGSVVGTTGNPGQANYCAAKAGVIGFSKALALEVGSRNITVNTVSPGFVQTDMTDKLTDEQREAIFARIPMQRMGTVDDIAAAVLFLASDMGAYMTGQTLHVNGGMSMI